MSKEYIFRTSARESFFVSGVTADTQAMEEYTKEDIEMDASMLMALLLNAFHKSVGIKLQELMIEAGELGATLTQMEAKADTGEVDLMDLHNHKLKITAFMNRMEEMATHRLINAPNVDNEEVEDFQ